MPSYISWKEINNHRYFAWGLQPQEGFTKSPIPCPDYCHKYHLIFKKKAEIEQKKGFPEDCSKQKEEYFALLGQLNDIKREDPEAISWKFFRMPEVQSNIDKLKDLLAGALFNKAVVDEIRQKISTPSVFFPDLDMDRLKYYAGRWAGMYPCIKQIILYKAGHDHAVDYEEPPSEEDIKLGLVSPLPEKNEDYQTKYIIAVTLLNKDDKYLDWVDVDGFRESICDCDHISDLLPQCYIVLLMAIPVTKKSSIIGCG